MARASSAGGYASTWRPFAGLTVCSPRLRLPRVLLLDHPPPADVQAARRSPRPSSARFSRTQFSDGDRLSVSPRRVPPVRELADHRVDLPLHFTEIRTG